MFTKNSYFENENVKNISPPYFKNVKQNKFLLQFLTFMLKFLTFYAKSVHLFHLDQWIGLSIFLSVFHFPFIYTSIYLLFLSLLIFIFYLFYFLFILFFIHCPQYG